MIGIVWDLSNAGTGSSLGWLDLGFLCLFVNAVAGCVYYHAFIRNRDE